MAKLVAQNTGELAFVENAPDTLSDGHGRMFGIAPCRERVRGFLRNDVNLRHRQTRSDGEIANDAIELRIIVCGNLLGAIHLQNDLVAEPVAKEIHGAGHDQSENGSVRTADHVADPDDERS